MQQHFDCQTFARIGVSNPSDQHILTNLLNGCVAIASDANANAFVNFARSLKRKAYESEVPPHQQAKTGSTPNAPEPDPKTKELNDLREALKLQQSTGNATILQLSTAQREIKDLRLMIQSKTKECITLTHDIGVLEKCNSTLTHDIGVLEKCNDKRSADIKRMVVMLQSSSPTGAAHQQVVAPLKEIVTCLNTIVPEIDQIVASYNDEIQIETHRLRRRIMMLKDQIIQTTKKHSFNDDFTGCVAVCPIPTRDGHIVSLKTILTQWKSYPSDYEGDFCSTFKSNSTNSPTSIASVEQVQLIRKIANDIGIDLTMPLQIQYTGYNATWCDFMFSEQIAIFSRMCKMIRCKCTLKPEIIIVSGGTQTLSLRLAVSNDSETSFTMHLELLSKTTTESDTQVYTRVLVNDTTTFPEVVFKSEHPASAAVSQTRPA